MLTMFGLLSSWVFWQVGSVQIQAPQSALANPFAWIVLARELWQQYSGTLLWTTVVLVVWSVLSWMLLEAFFRSGFLPDTGRGFFENVRLYFKPFLACSSLKSGLLVTLSFLMGVIVFGPYLKTPVQEWSNLSSNVGGAAVVTAVLWVVLWFFLLMFETAIRLAAVDALGRELFTVMGAIGTLVVFETIVVGGIAGLAVIGLSFVSNSTSAVIFLLILSVGAFLVTVFHSYLLIVRYSAINVVMRTSSGPEGTGIIGHVDEFRDRSHPRFWFPVHSADRPTNS